MADHCACRLAYAVVIAALAAAPTLVAQGYRKMIWTTARLDAGHWNVPITHYGHVEKPRELAGG